jgi:Uma2 family endonuclease
MTRGAARTHREREQIADGDPPLRRFTVDEYERMIAADIVHEGERVELIEGEIVAMASMGSVHAACVRRSSEALGERTRGRAQVSVQCPIRLPPASEPEPDIALLRPRSDHYAAAHPGPEDVLLVIEAAHSTLAYDRRFKIPIYARAGITETWLVDLDTETVQVFREPRAGQYRSVTNHHRGDRLTASSFPGMVIDVVEILGTAE